MKNLIFILRILLQISVAIFGIFATLNVVKMHANPLLTLLSVVFTAVFMISIGWLFEKIQNAVSKKPEKTISKAIPLTVVETAYILEKTLRHFKCLDNFKHNMVCGNMTTASNLSSIIIAHHAYNKYVDTYIQKAFLWKDSPEGHDFWENVHLSFKDACSQYSNMAISKENMHARLSKIKIKPYGEQGCVINYESIW